MLQFPLVQLLTVPFSLGELEKQVEEHKKKVELQMQNYCTTNPAEYAKVKREGSDESDQSTKVRWILHEYVQIINELGLLKHI